MCTMLAEELHLLHQALFRHCLILPLKFSFTNPTIQMLYLKDLVPLIWIRLEVSGVDILPVCEGILQVK